MGQPTVILFDIDGTLIRSGGAGGKALDDAFEFLFGVKKAFRQISFVGSTDLRIAEDVFQIHFSRSPTHEETQSLFSAYLDRLAHYLDLCDYEVNPGVKEAIDIFSRRKDTALGLATGNIKGAAFLKLAAGKMDKAFSFGGYGSDAASRTALTELGALRGCKALNVAREDARVLVLGDSIYDIRSAREIGAISVGVCTGWTDREPLAAENPDHLFDTLANPQVWIKTVLG
jgi:phosphoglycolate phosphatase